MAKSIDDMSKSGKSYINRYVFKGEREYIDLDDGGRKIVPFFRIKLIQQSQEMWFGPDDLIALKRFIDETIEQSETKK